MRLVFGLCWWTKGKSSPLQLEDHLVLGLLLLLFPATTFSSLQLLQYKHNWVIWKPWVNFEPCICCMAKGSLLKMVKKKKKRHTQHGLRHISFQLLPCGKVSSCWSCSMAAATAGRKGGVPAASAGHWHSRPWQCACCHSHWGNWEELGKPESSLQVTFQKSICFLSFEIHFLCFLNTFKIPNKHQIKKKIIKSSTSLFLWIGLQHTQKASHTPLSIHKYNMLHSPLPTG